VATSGEPVLEPPLESEPEPAFEDDRLLVRRLKHGDPQAFQDLVTAYKDRIFGLMVRMIGNRQEAEDLAQEVFISVHRSIAGYRGEGRLFTWLYRIATNTCRNRIKYLKGRPAVGAQSVSDEAVSPSPGVSGAIAGPEAMLEGSRLQLAIQRELEALDPDHRLLVVLRDIEGLSYEDIQRVTGLQEGTVKSRLHRARLALKERLAPYLR
jgi:RNA polymerase sigma-70 factor (ECF subfamily)